MESMYCSTNSGVLNLYFLIYPLENFKSDIYLLNFFYIFLLLQMPIVVGKSVNYLPTKFTSKPGQIYPGLRNPEPTEVLDFVDLRT